MNCPCCQQPVPDGSLLGILFTRSESRIMANLAGGRSVSREELLSGVYADKVSLCVLLWRLRKKIKPRGWAIVNKSHRYSLQGAA